MYVHRDSIWRLYFDLDASRCGSRRDEWIESVQCYGWTWGLHAQRASCCAALSGAHLLMAFLTQAGFAFGATWSARGGSAWSSRCPESPSQRRRNPSTLWPRQGASYQPVDPQWFRLQSAGLWRRSHSPKGLSRGNINEATIS